MELKDGYLTETQSFQKRIIVNESGETRRSIRGSASGQVEGSSIVRSKKELSPCANRTIEIHSRAMSSGCSGSGFFPGQSNQ